MIIINYHFTVEENTNILQSLISILKGECKVYLEIYSLMKCMELCCFAVVFCVCGWIVLILRIGRFSISSCLFLCFNSWKLKETVYD